MKARIFTLIFLVLSCFALGAMIYTEPRFARNVNAVEGEKIAELSPSSHFTTPVQGKPREPTEPLPAQKQEFAAVIPKALPKKTHLFSGLRKTPEPLALREEQPSPPVLREEPAPLARQEETTPLFVAEEPEVVAVLPPLPEEIAPVILPEELVGPPVAPPMVEAPMDPQPLPAPEEEFTPRSHLSGGLGFQYARIDAQDKSSGDRAIFLSALSPAARFSWLLDWSESWSSLLSVHWVEETFESGSSSSSRLKDQKGSRFGFDMGGVRHWASGGQTSFVLAREKNIYTWAATDGSVHFDRVENWAAQVKHEKQLVKVKKAKLGAFGSLKLGLASQGKGYATGTSFGAKLGVFMEHAMDSCTLRGEAFYGQSKQSSTFLKQTTAESGILFSLGWSFL